MILITGANGQLGNDFKKLFDSLNVNYISTDLDDLDITNEKSVDEFFKNNKNITIIINCAAYNDVDKAEEEVEKCYSINTKAPHNLSKKAKEIGAIFVTYSTDFIFYSDKIRNPFETGDIPTPPSHYSKSKLEGENLVLSEYDNTFVIRTSWVFGIANKNFIKQVIEWSRLKNELNIVDDQISSPTYSKDLAYYSWNIIKTGVFGVYHISNNGECSKYEQAKYILKRIGWKGILKKSKTSDFKLMAKRSNYSKLSLTKTESLLKEKIPTWEDAIDRYIKEIEQVNL